MKPAPLFRWSDSTRAAWPDERGVAAAIIRAHRAAERAGQPVHVLYDRSRRRVECYHRHAGIAGVWLLQPQVK